MKASRRNLIAALAITSGSLVTTSAYAQFGALLGMGSKPSGGAASADPEAFLKSAQAAEKLMKNSAALLAQGLTSKEKAAELEAGRKAANAATDPAEKNALSQDVSKKEASALNEAMNNANIGEAVKNLNADQKALVAAASFNFMLALLQDKALVEQATGLISSMSGNPMNLSKLGGIKDAAASLKQQIAEASVFADKMPKIFAAVGVTAPITKDDKPKEMKQVVGD
ncbi:hypothetical protein [Rhodoferax mekongensis]|uniref:DUF4197 domain-containing protein n=1 Tax=Rhodoferax mekongensis TaxID=3068341 RepID=A0ABZ0AUS4_9BURK|nr:hypothetical protein [Rhodoferax sp. TBRC 17307]WNO03390.1 hypothetical protein RAN89_10665 [Rhodoferax sp. TBRC 17307]